MTQKDPKKEPKTRQLQIRVSEEEKARIQERAARAGMDVSKWLLRMALPPAEERFQSICRKLASGATERSYVLAELNDFLCHLNAGEFRDAVAFAPAAPLAAFEAAYVAAMVEQAAAVKGAPAPDWTRQVGALEQPWFASRLTSLRLHLLTSSPPPFRRRNLFVDSTIGDRV
ncbi:MAG: plasmid mobilization protein [Pseudomonadales bacterium]